MRRRLAPARLEPSLKLRDLPFKPSRFAMTTLSGLGAAIGAWVRLRQVRALNRTQRFIEANRALAEASASYPGHRQLQMTYARDAELAGDLDEMRRRWEEVCSRLPDDPVAHAAYGAILRQQGARDRAGSVLGTAVSRFIGSWEIAAEHAWLALDCGDSCEALRRSRSAMARFARHPSSLVVASAALRTLARTSDADALLFEAEEGFAGGRPLAPEYAMLRQASELRVPPQRRWPAIWRPRRDLARRYAEFGAALLRIGRPAEADAFLAVAVARFSGDPRLATLHARAADAAADRSDEALRRWQNLSARFSNNPAIAQGLSRAVFQRGLAHADTHGTEPEFMVPKLVPDGCDEAPPPFRELLFKFESMGENCELGFVQRHFKAEPLGLLRWAGIPFEELLLALQTGFAGVGTPEQTMLYLDPVSDEYRTFDRRYCINMHAFQTKDLKNQEKIYDTLCRRLRFLRDKLISDLQDSKKIFVHVTDRPLDDRQIAALHAELLRYGRNTMLCVRASHGTEATGRVQAIGDGLLTGSIGRLGYNGKRWDVSFDCWLALCREAVRLSAET